MKITKITAYQVDLPLKEGRYAWSNDNAVEAFDSTVVAVETDAGITGYGECCPLGPAYLPAYAAGVRAGLEGNRAEAHRRRSHAHLARSNRHMDEALRGHPYVKAPIDIACWDILGKVAELPVYALLGGAQQAEVKLYRAISQETPDDDGRQRRRLPRRGLHQVPAQGRRQRRHRHRAHPRLPRDAEIRRHPGRRRQHRLDHARGRARGDAVRDVDVYIEQPCRTYEECLTVRRRTSLPFVLDENIDGIGMLLRAIAEGAMDVINLKISKVGGLTKARQMRDLCVAAGIAMTIEDTWGGDIVTAAIAHLARSTPDEFCFSATDFNSYGTKSISPRARPSAWMAG